MRYLLGLVLFISFTSSSRAAIYSMSTEFHPVSSQTKLQVYLGPSPPVGMLAFETVDLATTGTAVFDDDLSDTYVRLNQVEMHLENLAPTRVTVLSLGTFLFEMTDIEIRMQDVLAIRNGNTFQIATGPLQSPFATVGIYGGNIRVSDATGVLAGLIPGVFTIDYAQTPKIFYAYTLRNLIEGTFDDGAGGFSPNAELNVGNPTFPVDADIDTWGTLRVIPELHFAVVPETTSIVLAACGMGTLMAGFLWRTAR